MHNLYADPTRQENIAKLKAEMLRQKSHFQDDDQFADKLPDDDVDRGKNRPKAPARTP